MVYYYSKGGQRVLVHDRGMAWRYERDVWRVTGDVPPLVIEYWGTDVLGRLRRGWAVVHAVQTDTTVLTAVRPGVTRVERN